MAKVSLKKRMVVFLTESGHSPTADTIKHYLEKFATEDTLCKKGENLTAFGGPTGNSCLHLAQMLKNDEDLLVAVFLDNNNCQVVRGDKFRKAFIDKACTAAGGCLSSWYIATEILKDMEGEKT